MKSYKTPSPGKLVKQFDSELKNILMSDLKMFKSKNPFINRVKQDLIRDLAA